MGTAKINPMKHLITFLLPLLLAGCAGERSFPEVKKLSEYKHTDFVTTPQSPLPAGKNAVYSVPMLYTWQQIKQIGNGQVVIDKSYNELALLNDSKSWEKALKEGEYTATATVEDGNKITAYAEFSKSLPFKIKLKDHREELKFKGQPVATFGANAAECYEFDLYNAIGVWYYNNDNDFAITLVPEDRNHLVIVYMPDEKPDNLQELFDRLDEKMKSTREERSMGLNSWKYDFGMEGDELLIPKFSFNIETNYSTLEDSEFTMGKKPFIIEKAYQRTAFLLDEEGAKAESEALEETTVEESPVDAIEEKPHPKKLHFNKPFLVILKRTDSPNPYFAMWVDNTELMQE